jgi:predicted membrane protein
MINGVLLIVAAVLFAVVHVFGGLGILWLWIAAFYLVAGILDLILHVVKEKVRVRSANKKAQKTAQEAEASRKQAEESRKEVEEAKKQLVEPKQEVNV